MNKKGLLIGQWRKNAGPSNVNRSLIKNSDGSLLYLSATQKIAELFELVYKLTQCKSVLISGVCSQKKYKIIKRFRKNVYYLMHGCIRYENKVNNLHLSSDVLQMEDNILRDADKIICVSKQYSEWVKVYYPEYEDKITYVNNGVVIKPRKKVDETPYTIAVTGGNRGIKNNIDVYKAVEHLNS